MNRRPRTYYTGAQRAMIWECQRRLKTAQFWRLKIAHHDWFGSVTRLRLACAPDWFRCFDIGLQSAIQLGVLTHSIAVATNID